jgi:HK97 gp10 family phage protein
MAQTIVTFQLHGFEEAKKELEAMSKNVQRKGAHAMASAGAAIVRDAARPKVYKAMGSFSMRGGYVLQDSGYFSYIPEGKGEYAGMTVKGRSKWGGIRARFSPGWVAKNIFIGKSKKGSRLGNATWRVFLAPQAWFGRFIEYGGKHNPARPFMRPALKENIPRVIDAMRLALYRFLSEQYYKHITLKRTSY